MRTMDLTFITGLSIWPQCCLCAPEPSLIHHGTVAIGRSAADSNQIRSALNPSAAVCLLFEPWPVSISYFSGIPGKKCGTIIFAAEELSNCRVSITGQTGVGGQNYRPGPAGSAWQPRHSQVRIKGHTAPIQNHRSDLPRLVSQVRPC